VVPREAPAAQQAQQEQAQYNRAWATAEAMAYYNVLKDRFKVQISVPKPKDALGQ
jgi:peptidyl-prolyl cis-trans isomerase D